MDDKLKQYAERLLEEVKIAETRLARLGQHLASPELTSLAEWKTRLREAATQWRAKREAAAQAGQRVKAWIEEMEHATGAPFDDSNLAGEVSKAESQANREEGLALDAMVVAAQAILQAEVAILKAFTTRKTAFDLERFQNVF